MNDTNRMSPKNIIANGAKIVKPFDFGMKKSKMECPMIPEANQPTVRMVKKSMAKPTITEIIGFAI